MKISFPLFLFFFVITLLAAPTHDVAAKTTATSTHNQVAVEKKVREYFKDIPDMIEIARCESKFRQFTDAGNVLRGGSAGGMIGVFQFFESIHAPAAKALGFDLTTLDGNLAYAKHVYQSQGTTPWNSAKSCWASSNTATTTLAVTTDKQAQLKQQIATLTKLIALLQKQLVAKQLAQL